MSMSVFRLRKRLPWPPRQRTAGVSPQLRKIVLPLDLARL